MKRAGIVLHGTRAEALELGRWLGERLADRGIEARALTSDAERIGVEPAAPDRFADGLDLVFALGGDGTLLRAAELAYRGDIPLLGVNLGRLGFLAEIERESFSHALDRVLDDGFEIEERMVLEGEVSGPAAGPIWALNEAIIGKTAVGRAIKLGLAVGGRHVASFAADGLIVATPTGSTAYSFSAHGPVVSPAMRCLLVTPVSPHALFDRCLVLAPEEEASIRVYPDPDAAVLALDGRDARHLPPGSEVRLRAGARPLRLAKISPTPFWELVKEKFHLPSGPEETE